MFFFGPDLENVENLDRDSRDVLECGKQKRIRQFSRDSSSEKTPFVTPFSVPDFGGQTPAQPPPSIRTEAAGRGEFSKKS